LAGVALALEQPQRVVRLLAVVEAARETSGTGRIADARNAARIVAMARIRLPEPAFAVSWEEGRMLQLAVAIAEATMVASSTSASLTDQGRGYQRGAERRFHSNPPRAFARGPADVNSRRDVHLLRSQSRLGDGPFP
jgi:hypothetical protein